LLAAVLLAALCVPVLLEAQQKQPPPVRKQQQQAVTGAGGRHGRLYPPVDLGLLEGPDRDAWQMPDRVMEALRIFDGAVVGDLGAGGGWFTIRLARFIGPKGKVYAEDIQPQMIEAIQRRVVREGLLNVQTVQGTSKDPRLPGNRLDAILIVEVSNEMEDRVELLKNAARALKPHGRIGIIDYKKDGLGPGPALEERVDPEDIERDAAAAGLRLLERHTFLPYQFFLIFGKNP
jgi:SAM-dependent methyltransferase